MSSILRTKFKQKCFTELAQVIYPELWIELCPIKLHIEALTPNVTAFGSRDFMELRLIKVIRVRP